MRKKTRGIFGLATNKRISVMPVAVARTCGQIHSQEARTRIEAKRKETTRTNKRDDLLGVDFMIDSYGNVCFEPDAQEGPRAR